MNRNRKLQAAAVILSAGIMLSSVQSSASGVAEDSPFAGILANLYVPENITTVVDADPDNNTALSGATFMMSSALGCLAQGEVEVEIVDQALDPEETQGRPEFANIGIATVDTYVNIRSNPSEDGEVVAKLYKNGACTVHEKVDGWYHITSGNADGYIREDLISVGNDDLAISVSYIVARVTAEDALNVRQEMSTESTVLGSYSKGEGLIVTDLAPMESGWVKVTTPAGEGYVSTDYTTVRREYNSVAETREEEQARIEAEIAAAAEAARLARQSGGSSTQSPASSGGGSTRTYNPPSGGNGAAVAQYALQFVGNPYVWGGTSLTNGADCSGFVLSVYKQFGVSLPHSSYSQANYGYSVPASQMQAGDVVCYGGHVGIAIDNQNIVHASNARDGIKVSNAFYRGVVSIRRFF